MSSPSNHSTTRIVTAYAIAAAAWILLSDAVLAGWEGASLVEWMSDSGKGLLFVVFSTAGLFWILRREESRRAAIMRELQLSEERWQTALESAGDGLWDWNVETGEIYFSRLWKLMLGHEDGEIANQFEEWDRRLHPEDRMPAHAAVQRHLEGLDPAFESIHRLRAKDGTYRWIRARGRVVELTPEGKPRRMIGTHVDITASVQARERIADELAFTHAIFDTSPVGMISYRADGHAESANAAAARIAGTTVEELRQQNFRRIESWKASGLLAAAEEALATGRETTREIDVTTTFGRRLWLAAQFVPFHYCGEQRLLFLMRDVSEQRESQRQLKLLQAALEAAPNGVAITDARGTIEWINPAFTTITGYAGDEIRGQNVRILKSGRHPPAFYAQMWGTISQGRVWTGEVQNSRKDGTLYTEQMTIAPVRDTAGGISHYVAIKQDISERKSLEQQLARTQRLESIGLLASGIAHDLNNIFTPILLSLELLKIKYPTADGRKTIELIEHAGARGAGIVKQVLTFARGVDGERAEVQGGYLLKELAQMLQETLPRQIQVELNVASNLPPAMGDATQLHQVMLNLAINARDAMPAGGLLTFAAREVCLDESWSSRHPGTRPGLHLALSVTDTGTGIPPAVVEHMFEPFFSTKPRGQGTGLGLSTVYGIVKSHGGAIDVATRIDEGTTFTVYLPAVAAVRPTTLARNSRPPHAAPFAGGGRRLLVVDDEESIRLVALHALQRHGFVVETAVDGVEALEIFRAGPGRFSAVVTDLMMPRMGGRELVREIRVLDAVVPLLACSGLSDGESGESGGAESLSAAGVRTLLRKPFTEAELLAALERELAAAG